MGVMIRAAQEADTPACAACVHNAFHKYIERIGKPPAPMLLDFAALIKEGKVWVAEYRGAISGVLVLYPADKGFYLDTVAVVPAHQRLGIGRALLQFAEAEARRRGFEAVYLCTNVKMTENQTFYPHVGYVEYDCHAEDGYDRIFYRKEVG